jgi:hypothetical protein
MKMMRRRIAIAVSAMVATVFGAIGAAATDKPVTLLADSYEFAFLGGLRVTYEEFVLSPSETLSITRTYTFHRDEPPHTCSYPIPSCGRDDVVDACDLKAVLSNDHVLAMWPVEGDKVYGFDRRPQDGVVFSIEALGKGLLTVAELCREDGADCSADHQALIRLRKTFTDLIDQAVSSSECASLSR